MSSAPEPVFVIPLGEALSAVVVERMAQDHKWGEQNHPDGTGQAFDTYIAEASRRQNNDAALDGTITWRDILHEEVYEAFAETDLERLREELVQVAAVAIAWVEAIDRREDADQ